MTIPEVLVFLLIMYVLINPIMGAYSFTHPPRIRISFRTPEDLAVPYDKVTLVATDGVELKGWYIHSQNGAAVILLHGHSGNRLGLMFHAEKLVQAGYGVLMFDLRAHGNSGGRIFARSEAGVQDVQTAVSFLSKRADVQAGKIGVMGLSVGGLFALHAAARTVAIHAVATDGASPATLSDLPAPRSFLDRFLRYPVQRYYLAASQWFARQPELTPSLSIIPRLRQPLLFISTGRGVEQRMVRQYYAVAKTHKQLWEVPEAEHANGWLARPAEYTHQLISFFDYALLHKELPPPPTASVENFQGKTADSSAPHIAYDATLSLAAANGIALLIFPLVYLLLFVPYQMIWGVSFWQLISIQNYPPWWVVVPLFIGSILVHELLHVVGYRWVGKVDKTAVLLGMNWKLLTPYAHCKAPLTARAYRLSVILPGLLLGVLPGLIGLLLGSSFWVVWAALMLVTAGGDAAILWAVRDVPAETLVLDHPTRAGCSVLKEPGEME